MLFSLLKKKQKEKSSHSTCTARFKYHPKIIQETITIDSRQQKSPAGGEQAACPPVILPFSHLKLGREVSGDSPPAVTLPFYS